jgi:hypothetical protein
MTERPPSRALYRNMVSYVGGLVVAGSALLIVVGVIFGLTLGRSSPYLGIITYMLLPGALTFGLLIFLYGMRRESLRRRRVGSDEALPYPRLDLNEPRQRRRFALALAGMTVLVVLLAFAGYNAFLFSESVAFCGRTCHTVMEPEYTAYLGSPHARVPCVDCHVGSGASWYVKSKLSGARQVVHAVRGTYPRPIPVPVENLRPARETCEHCHWPEKFFGGQLLQTPRFRYDEKSTPEQLSLLVKTGGGGHAGGQRAGIHWHMVTNVKLRYTALDKGLQKIATIHIERQDGTKETFTSKDLQVPPGGGQPEHVMDCMDCHNRPTHIYPPPETALDADLAAGRISRDLPWIKKVAFEALARPYPSKEAAHSGIRDSLNAFYREKYPDIEKRAPRAVDQAIANVSALYDRSVFPKMNVSWSTYTTNIGHRDWAGCFRCHDGRHVSSQGRPLSNDCTICHTMPTRGPLAPLGAEVPASNPVNWHVWPLEGKHAELLCTKCHSAGKRMSSECSTCHTLPKTGKMMSTMACTDCHKTPGKVQPLVPCADCHSDLKGAHKKGDHPKTACGKCHKAHAFKVEDRATCLACHTDKKDHNADGGACVNCHDFKK